MTPFDKAFSLTLGIEGDYSDDPDDPGGKTKFGITEAVARAFGYKGSMNKLPLPLAKGIYRKNYWALLRLDDVAELSEGVASELFDTAVNLGVAFAGKSLQKALNAFNNNEKHYADVKVDGLVGQMTITALKGYFDKRKDDGEIVLLRALNSLQGAAYLKRNEKYVFGWFLNRVDI